MTMNYELLSSKYFPFRTVDSAVRPRRCPRTAGLSHFFFHRHSILYYSIPYHTMKIPCHDHTLNML